MAGYRARPNAILHKAIDRGVSTPRSTVRALAAITGLHRTTITRAIAGGPVSTGTMAAIEAALHAKPGELFEPIPDGDPMGSLRVAR
jgi:hypothetical protein